MGDQQRSHLLLEKLKLGSGKFERLGVSDFLQTPQSENGQPQDNRTQAESMSESDSSIAQC